jgi:hypothetical protein
LPRPPAPKPTPASRPSASNEPLIPRPTDARAELFFLVGRIAGQGVEGASRIAELVIELTAPTAISAVEQGGE